MFQSILKKVNESLDSDSVANALSHAQTTLATITAAPQPEQYEPSSSGSTPLQSLQSHLAVSPEVLEKVTREKDSLEAQLKDLRLKAKLKISQLQRQLDIARGSSGPNSSGGDASNSSTQPPSLTATPTQTAPASPSKLPPSAPSTSTSFASTNTTPPTIAHTSTTTDGIQTTDKSLQTIPASTSPIHPSRSPVDIEMIESLQQKVESLSNQLASLSSKQKPATSTSVSTSPPPVSPLQSAYHSFASLTGLQTSYSSSDPLQPQPQQQPQNQQPQNQQLQQQQQENFETQVTSLRTALTSKSEALATALTSLDAHKHQLSATQVQVDALTRDLSEAQKQIETLQVENGRTTERFEVEIERLKGLVKERDAEVETLKGLLRAKDDVAIDDHNGQSGEAEPNNLNAEKIKGLQKDLTQAKTSLESVTQQYTRVATQVVELMEAVHAQQVFDLDPIVVTSIDSEHDATPDLESMLAKLTRALSRTSTCLKETSSQRDILQQSLKEQTLNRYLVEQELAALQSSLHLNQMQTQPRPQSAPPHQQQQQEQQPHSLPDNNFTTTSIDSTQNILDEMDRATTNSKRIQQSLHSEISIQKTKTTTPTHSHEQHQKTTEPVRVSTTSIDSTQRVLQEMDRATNDSARIQQALCDEIETLKSKLAASDDANTSKHEARNVAQTAGIQAIQGELKLAEKTCLELREAKAVVERQVVNLSSQIGGHVARISDLETELENVKGLLTGKEGELEEGKRVVSEREKEIEVLKKRVRDVEESSGGKAFLLDEQVMDLKIQIANRQQEINRLVESQQRANAEHEKSSKEGEDKIKKLKGILGQVNKSYQDSKKLIAEKDQEIERLQTDVDALETRVRVLQDSETELKSSVQRHLSDLQDEKELSQMNLLTLETRVSDLQTQLKHERETFQSYKIRAQLSLQKSQESVYKSRASDLEGQNASLMQENMKLNQKVGELEKRVENLTGELSSALDQLGIFEDQVRRFEGSSKELAVLRHEVEACNRRIELEKELHIEALRTKEGQHKTAIESLKKETLRDTTLMQTLANQKEEEIKALKSTIQSTTASLEATKKELDRARAEVEAAKSAAVQATTNSASGTFASLLAATGGSSMSTQGHASLSSPGSSVLGALSGGFFSSIQSPGTQSNQPNQTVPSPVVSRRGSMVATPRQPESFAELLGRRQSAVDGFTPSVGAAALMKERELVLNFQKVSELLTEAEDRIAQLLEQEKVLKEEIRNNERAQKRSELLVKQQNVEYLKNIVLSFLETDSKEQLLPVITKVLELSPDEVKRVRNSIMNLEDDKVRVAMPNFGFF